MGLKKKAVKTFFKEMTQEELKDGSLYERALGHKMTKAGFGLFATGAMAVSTINTITTDGMSKAQKLGYVSVGENLDRLVSYDGSGFTKGVNKISNGNPEVMKDIVDNTFNNMNQLGVSGDIVFALHNMREG